VAIPEVAVQRVRRFCDDQTPLEAGDQMRLEATVDGNKVTLADCRPPWDGSAGEWTSAPFAQLRYQAASKLWSLYWGDSNDRWHRYDEIDHLVDLETALTEIANDPSCIFFG
jgi:hypothetical protein